MSQRMAEAATPILPFCIRSPNCNTHAVLAAAKFLASAGAGATLRVGWWPMTRPDEVFPVDSPKDRRPWARVPAPQTPLGFREMGSRNEMVDLWSTLGFVVETTPDGATKDLYEVEFNKAPPAAVLVAVATPKPAAGSKKAAKTRKKGRATSKA